MDNENMQQPMGGSTSEQQRDDSLFEALGKNRKNRRRRILRTILIVVIVLSVLLVSGISFLRRCVQEQFGSSASEVLSYSVQTGTISTLVSGSGILSNVDTESVSVPDGVELTEILVQYGDSVESGDLLATVDMASVRTAMADLQSQIDELDGEIQDAEDDKVSSYLKAGVSGRVKQIFANPGDNVSDQMVAHGALAVLSLDGYMAVKIESGLLNAGDTVSVLRKNGAVLDGIVESAAGGYAVILVTDDGPEYYESVTVISDDGMELGAGDLYIHKPLAVTGYAGTISSVSVQENTKVYASSTLFILSDTTFSANYDALLRQRSEAEETLLELLSIQRNGGVTAPISGSVYSVSELSGEGTVTSVAVISPDVSMSVTISVDESDILSLEAGQEASVTVRSVSEDAYSGIVTQIDKTSAEGAYTAQITLDKAEGMLPGMTASVNIKIQGVENAVLVPVDALHQTSTGAYVYTSYDEESQTYGGAVDVITGLSNDDYVEIKSGLQEGDTVYYTESTSVFDMFTGMGGMSGMSGMGKDQTGQFGGEMPGGTQDMPSGGSKPSGDMPGGRGGS